VKNETTVFLKDVNLSPHQNNVEMLTGKFLVLVVSSNHLINFFSLSPCGLQLFDTLLGYML
jgi:hypothetical protein